MVEGGKKKNKNRGKNRNKATAAAPETARTDSTSSETVVEPRPTPQKAQSPSPLVASAPPVQTAPAAQGGGATAAQNALLKNLALDQPPHPGWFEVKRAEASYYRASPPKVETARPKPAQLAAEESDAIDLLGSDDELRAQPPTVQPVPRGPARKKVDPASQTVAAVRSGPGERSFVLLKPEAVQRHMVGQIMSQLERRGFKLVAAKYMQAPRALLQRHYADLSGQPFYPPLIDYMASGPVVPMVWEGLHVVQMVRTILGETVPQNSCPGSIRGDLCVDGDRSVVHASDSVASAQKEIRLWFKDHELVTWQPGSLEWLYEDENRPQVPQAHFQNGSSTKAQSGSLAAEIAKARQHIKNSLECVDNLTAMAGSQDLVQKIQKLENDNKNLQKVCDDLKNLVLKLDKRVQGLETGNKGAPAKTATKDDDDDDVDLFGSESDEEEDADKVRIREERLKAYHEKKSKKPTLIAKTSVLLDVKPWDDETDMDAMLAAVKTIKKDGLLWGASKLVPVGYGIKKLQVMCVVEDEKVSIDELCEQIAEFEDFVQSADISSMSKI